MSLGSWKLPSRTKPLQKPDIEDAGAGDYQDDDYLDEDPANDGWIDHVGTGHLRVQLIEVVRFTHG